MQSFWDPMHSCDKQHDVMGNTYNALGKGAR